MTIKGVVPANYCSPVPAQNSEATNDLKQENQINQAQERRTIVNEQLVQEQKVEMQSGEGHSRFDKKEETEQYQTLFDMLNKVLADMGASQISEKETKFLLRSLPTIRDELLKEKGESLLEIT